jgi:AGCS family alanine or glycine:cation symporter
MESVKAIVTTISRWVWGIPLIAILLGVSAYFSFRLKFLQIFRLRLAIQYLMNGESSDSESIGDISHFASLCTALSATIGIGNIVGVALAISAGGPGAMFWMWIAAFFGMAAKYAEGFLAIKYRKVSDDGKIAGGPMYYIEMGLGNKVLARIFAVCGTGVALLGIGTWTQANAVASAAQSFGIPCWMTAILLGILVATVTVGGIHRISNVSEKVVPLMSAFYIGTAILVMIMKIDAVPQALCSIVREAFSTSAALGGGIGVTTLVAAQLGISRGIFSHESGLGSAAIAAAAAKTNSPVKQGLVSMMGAFFSIIICTMTGLVLIITCNDTGIFSSQCAIDGTLLTSCAFGFGIGMPKLGAYIVNIGILFFAFTTIIGWNYYGEKCIQYLCGNRAIAPYNVLFLFFVIIGPFFKINAIFAVADIMTGLMAVPNLLGLMGLSRLVVMETENFFRDFAAPAVKESKEIH